MHQGGFTIGSTDDSALHKVDYEPVAFDLYEQLGNVILPMFYDDPTAWAQVMKGAIKNAGVVNMYRAMRQYEKVYFPKS